MKILDRYILFKYLGTFFFIISLLIGITVVIDISEKVDNLVESDATLWMIITGYYFSFIPYITALLAPFFALVAVIFFTSQLASRSEIIAILNSGTSFYRMLVPYFVGATILAVGLWYCNNELVPIANKKRLEFERTYIYKRNFAIHFNFHRCIAPGTFIYIENYNPDEANGYKFSIDKFVHDSLVFKLRSSKIEWQKDKKKWRLSNLYTRTRNKDGTETITQAASADSVFSFEPKDFKFTDNLKEEMTTSQLVDYIHYLRQQGLTGDEFFEVERYRRTSSAFSIYILTLIGVSVASRKMRGGMGWHLVLGIGLSALYEVIMKFSITFSTNSTLPPIIGVWIPNIIFAVIAAYLLRKAPK
ncbi:MAG: LptF/LptG family permease [Chitinophagales bacterium]|nr:LptF/LptG family permease [Chitinophagales bacterium]